MKLKFTLMAMASAVAFTYQAQAGVLLQTTNHAKLNVSIVISTNTAAVDNGTSFHNGLKKAKIGTKDLLDLFAQWDSADRTIEPWKTAQLVVGFDSQWNGDVLVVDKTGTNVLFDANDTVDDFFVVNFFADFGTETFSGTDGNPGRVIATERGTGNWVLVDNGIFLTSTFLGDNDGAGGVGAAGTTLSESRDGTGAVNMWHVNGSLETPDEADQEFQGNFQVTSKGSINMSGHGTGSNQFLENKFD
jgi:hypothetical protein